MKNNSENARKNIFSRLGKSTEHIQGYSKESPKNQFKTFKFKVKNFKSIIERARAKVHICSERNWCDILSEVVEEKKINTMLYGRKTNFVQKLLQAAQLKSMKMPKMVEYKNPIERSKELLFNVDSSITSTIGGISETGSLILSPSVNEPRLMSLIPPIHIAVLYSNKIYDNFLEAIRSEKLNQKMPTNLILISGPSKTADIEQTLVYGVHGPKELIVLLIK